MARRSPAVRDDMATNIPTTDAEWRARLTPLQYNVIRKRGAERAFSGEFLTSTSAGAYCCAGCATPLFGSAAKFDSGSGWPAFRAPLQTGCIRTTEDHAWFQRRIEVSCAVCNAHLGQLMGDRVGGSIDDCAAPGSPHYRINSVALKFEPAGG